MFIVLFRFSKNKGKAGDFMQGHNQWIDRGFDDGVFLLVGSLQPGLGGFVLANGITLPELHKRVNDDPFVKEGIVEPEILEMDAKRADQRLSFLVG